MWFIAAASNHQGQQINHQSKLLELTPTLLAIIAPANPNTTGIITPIIIPPLPNLVAC